LFVGHNELVLEIVAFEKMVFLHEAVIADIGNNLMTGCNPVSPLKIFFGAATIAQPIKAATVFEGGRQLTGVLDVVATIEIVEFLLANQTSLHALSP
jgi:hypothetical protein